MKGKTVMGDRELYLVTGGAGFIGSHIAEALVKRGDRVRALDNLITGRRENLSAFADRIEFVECDIRDYAATLRAAEGARVIFHQAAVPSVPRSVADPALNHNINVDGTFNVLMAAREAGARRVVYAASSSAYGDTETLPKHEETPPKPLSPYAAAKLFGEYYCRVFTQVYNLETVSLRYFNVFGPRQDPSSPYSGVISKFITTLLHGETPVIYGDGGQSRDFTYIDNVVDANLRAAESAQAIGRVINIGTGVQITLNALLDGLQKIIGSDIPARYEETRAGDIRHSLADISRARELIGYLPLVKFADGLKRTVEWYRENQ
jgi:nucleoside-diphosphate-sugar epimerase